MWVGVVYGSVWYGVMYGVWGGKKKKERREDGKAGKEDDLRGG